MIKSTFAKFFKLEVAGGILLMIAAILAMVLKNSPAGELYQSFLEIPGEVRLGELYIAKPLFLWVNDLWMAIFFFMFGRSNVDKPGRSCGL